MYLAAGTSALAVLVSMITSISSFMGGGTPIDWTLIGLELVGVVVGSIVGPRTSKYIPDICSSACSSCWPCTWASTTHCAGSSTSKCSDTRA
jgi:hypothetical protein